MDSYFFPWLSRLFSTTTCKLNFVDDVIEINESPKLTCTTVGLVRQNGQKVAYSTVPYIICTGVFLLCCNDVLVQHGSALYRILPYRYHTVPAPCYLQ